MFSSQPDMKSSISRVICLRYKKWIQRKSGKFDNSFMMHFDFKLRQSNQSIKKVIIYFLKPMVLSNLKWRFTTMRSSTSSGINLALLGVTTLSDGKDPLRFRREDQLDELCKKGEPTLVMLPTFSWSMEDKSSGKTPSCGVLASGFSRLWWSIGKPWTKAEPEMMNKWWLFNSAPLHEMELHKMTKDLALRPQYAQYPNPNPKPDLFGQTRPEPDPESKSPTRHGLPVT